MKADGNKWFWVWTVLMTVQKANLNKPDAICEIWKNLILVKARNERAAYDAAVRIAKMEEGDCQGSLKLKGKPAITRFLGLADLGLVHDELESGSEILWQLQRCRQRKAQTLIKDKTTLLATVKKELSYIS